jgi:hypothetical protein
LYLNECPNRLVHTCASIRPSGFESMEFKPWVSYFVVGRHSWRMVSLLKGGDIPSITRFKRRHSK